MQRQPPKNESVLQVRSAMTYNTIDDTSLASSSLHSSSHHGSRQGLDDIYEELNGSELDLKRAAFGQRTQKDISMDLNDLLQEIEGDDDHSNHSYSSGSSKSASLAFETEDIDTSERRIGNKLILDDLPSESKGLDWGSLNWGSFRDSFKKRVSLNGSRRLLRRKSSKKTNLDDADAQPSKRKKSVRFLKFETILPSPKTFRCQFSNETNKCGHRCSDITDKCDFNSISFAAL